MSGYLSLQALSRAARVLSYSSYSRRPGQLSRLLSTPALPPDSDVDEFHPEHARPDPAEFAATNIIYPNLMEPDILYDSAHSKTYTGLRSGQKATVRVLNDPSYIVIDKELNEMVRNEEMAESNEEVDLLREKVKLATHQFTLIEKRVTRQTGKGKQHRLYRLVVVGNGNGLVGIGEGKYDDSGTARLRAFREAVRNMDYVERFENRTIWTDMSIKFGATRIIMRPRPVGFGLHCNPNIHQVLKAAGIKDISAKVWGSRNPVNVIKATCMLIQGGNAPLYMGDGVGGKQKRIEKGEGMRSKDSIERERGRKLLVGRTW